MDTNQRDAIALPAAGLLIYNTESKCLELYNGTEWTSLCDKPEFICGEDKVSFNYRGKVVTYGTVESANGRCWMDRNLGAARVAQSATDNQAYGDMFKWGRRDDGHQARDSDVHIGPVNTDEPVNKFIIILNSEDWRDPINSNLWQTSGGNTPNNPCPLGWRVPTKGEWQTEYHSWSPQNATGAFNSPLKLSKGGKRVHTNGDLNEVNTAGHYWTTYVQFTNPPFNKYADRLLYGDTSISGVSMDMKGSGNSVRCIKE